MIAILGAFTIFACFVLLIAIPVLIVIIPIILSTFFVALILILAAYKGVTNEKYL